MIKILKVIILIFIALGAYSSSHARADDIDKIRARAGDKEKMWLSYKYEMDTPVKFFVQYYQTKSEFSTFSEDWKEWPSLISSAKRKGCEIDKTYEVRYLNTVSLACKKVIPMEGQEIKYNHVKNISVLNALMEEANDVEWQQVDNVQDANLAILVELELTDLVNHNSRVNKTFHTAGTNISASKYEPKYVLGVTINGINSDPTVEDRIVFKVTMIQYLPDYPSNETLSSIMNAVGEKIRKQKNFGTKRSHTLRFTNFESAKK